MKRLLYLILKKDMIKKLSLKHGEQFINDVMETFGMSTFLMNKRKRVIDVNYKLSMERYLRDLEINKKMLENELKYHSTDLALIYERSENMKKQLEVIEQRIIEASNEIQEMNNADLEKLRL